MFKVKRLFLILAEVYFQTTAFSFKCKLECKHKKKVSIRRSVEFICIHKAAVDKVEFKSAHSAVTDIPTKPLFKSGDRHQICSAYLASLRYFMCEVVPNFN